MKTLHEWEPSDIDLKENKLHSTLAVALLVNILSVDKNPNTPPDDVSAKMVASFLNVLERSGFTIVPKDIPVAFLEGMRENGS